MTISTSFLPILLCLQVNIYTVQKFAVSCLVLIVFTITAQRFLLGTRIIEIDKVPVTHFNNFLIFKYSYYHLIKNIDLYQLHLTEHWDYYKYSPTFALLMFPFYYIPNTIGLFLWNILNAGIVFYAIWNLPNSNTKTRVFLLGFSVIELITSMQNSQCNAIIAGLLVSAFNLMEKQKLGWAAFLLCLATFIKPFCLLGFLLFILHPNKFRSFIFTILYASILFISPLVVITWQQLLFQYQSWIKLLQADHTASYGISVAGWLNSWFGIELKGITVLAGAIILILPLFKIKHYSNLLFRKFFLSSILIWVVIFNHKAESPTFIIAILGVAVWYFSQEKKRENSILIILAFIFTMLSPSDLFPKFIRDNYFMPYAIKVVPCILVWVKINLDLLFFDASKKAF